VFVTFRQLQSTIAVDRSPQAFSVRTPHWQRITNILVAAAVKLRTTRETWRE